MQNISNVFPSSLKKTTKFVICLTLKWALFIKIIKKKIYYEVQEILTLLNWF